MQHLKIEILRFSIMKFQDELNYLFFRLRTFRVRDVKFISKSKFSTLLQRSRRFWKV